MLHPELSKSIRESRQSNMADDLQFGLRRSKRLSMMPPPPVMSAPGLRVHPLEVRSHWTSNDQKEQNSLMLGILNRAELRMLQKLPGVGPKTAIKLHTQR
jgi:DNA uptake protein ComE-like DNA-binding protein